MIIDKHSSGSTVVFRKATMADVAAVAAILKMAVRRMLDEGRCQWDESYPNEPHVRADIDAGIGYVLETDGEVVGYGAVAFDGEPAYDHLEGRWLSGDEPYVVIHRMAVSQLKVCRGLGGMLLSAVERLAVEKGVRNIRIDTNFDNAAMLHLLAKSGFAYTGEVQYPRGSRKAFEKVL